MDPDDEITGDDRVGQSLARCETSLSDNQGVPPMKARAARRTRESEELGVPTRPHHPIMADRGIHLSGADPVRQLSRVGRPGSAPGSVDGRRRRGLWAGSSLVWV